MAATSRSAVVPALVPAPSTLGAPIDATPPGAPSTGTLGSTGSLFASAGVTTCDGSGTAGEAFGSAASRLDKNTIVPTADPAPTRITSPMTTAMNRPVITGAAASCNDCGVVSADESPTLASGPVLEAPWDHPEGGGIERSWLPGIGGLPVTSGTE